MLTDQMQNRYDRMFAYYDRNDDEAIDQADVTAAVDALTQVFDYTPASPKIKTIKEEYTKFWNMVAEQADINMDASLDRQQFETVMESLSADQRFLDVCKSSLSAEFDVVDRSGDGVVSRDEFAKLMQALRPTEVSVDQAFQEMDQDGDGMVTRDEYIAAWTEVINTSDPLATGSRIF